MRARLLENARSVGNLEHEAERKLQVAHVAVLGCDLAEGCSGRVGPYTVPVRMVERVIRFSAELKGGPPFVNDELFEKAHVPGVEARVVNHIPGQVAGDEGTVCRRAQVRWLPVRAH